MKPPLHSSYLEYNPVTFADRFPERARRVLLFGQPGVGKTTFAAQLAANLSTKS